MDEEHGDAHYHLGRILRRLGRTEEANEHFRLVVDVDPTHALSRVALAEGHYHLKDYETAHLTYKQALQFDGRSSLALHGLGATLLMLEQSQAAERVFELLTHLYPTDLAAHLGRGFCAEKQPAGSVRAVASYETILKIDPDHFKAHLALAHICATRGEHHVAVAEYRWCLERRPSDRDALVFFGEALVSLGRVDEARLVLEQALRVAPRYARAHYALGTLHAQAGRGDAAAECLTNAARLASTTTDANHGGEVKDDGSTAAATGIELDAPPVPIAVGIADDDVAYSEFGCLLELGKVRLEQGRHSAASKVFEMALKLKPTSASGWVALGNARAKLGEANAIQAYETALQCDPKSADALYGLGSTLLDTASNNNEKLLAMKHIERATEIDPMHVHALARLAANSVGGEYLSRVKSFQAAVDGGGGSSTTGDKSKGSSGASNSDILSLGASLFGLASALDSQSILPYRVLHLLQRSIELEPGRAAAHLLNGTTLSSLGRLSEAVKELRTSIRLDPRNPQTFLALGDTLLKVNDKTLQEEIETDAVANKDSSSENTLDYSTGLVMEAVPVFKAAIDLAPERSGK